MSIVRPIITNIITSIIRSVTGAVLGPELVTEGDFSNGGAAWTLGTGWTVPVDKAVGTNASNSNLLQALTLNIIKTYEITVDAVVVCSSFSLRFGDTAAGGAIGTITTTGSHKFTVQPAGGVIGINFRALGVFNGSIDNVSVKEIL